MKKLFILGTFLFIKIVFIIYQSLVRVQIRRIYPFCRRIIILITEPMPLDSGLANTTGAGFTVQTQQERGYAYQHFVLGLLEVDCWSNQSAKR